MLVQDAFVVEEFKSQDMLVQDTFLVEEFQSQDMLVQEKFFLDNVLELVKVQKTRVCSFRKVKLSFEFSGSHHFAVMFTAKIWRISLQWNVVAFSFPRSWIQSSSTIHS